MKAAASFFGLNSAGLSPAMNAAAATLFLSLFGRPQPDDESSSELHLGSIPAKNEAMPL
jgi:hypothetical protein